MNYIWMMIKGVFVGISNVIPGVSGGTMAVSFGIYDDVIHAFTHLRKEWKPSLKVLGPLVAGALIGAAGFAFIIEWLLNYYTLYTAFAFVGLILGGLPILYLSFKDSLKAEQRTISGAHILLFIVFFIIVSWMGVADVAESGLQSVDVGIGPWVILFFVGVVSASAMVIPGISGSLLMLIMGYYNVVINTINTFTTSLATLDFEALVPATILLSAYAIGMIFGIILISKIIDYFFKNFPGYTYSAILGLVLGSPIAVVSNTEALSDLTGANTLIMLIIALIIAAISFAFAYALGQTDDVTETSPEESKNTM